MDYKVSDIGLADFGRKEIELAEVEMPGLMALRQEYGDTKPLQGARISGCLHMTIQTAVLIETLKYLGAELRWCSCNIFSTQDHAAAAIARDQSAAVFAWKGQTVQERWECYDRAINWPNGTGPNMFVDDGADFTLLVHEGVKWENLYEQDESNLPDIDAAQSEDERELLKIIKRNILSNPRGYRDIAQGLIGASEQTTTGVLRLYERDLNRSLLYPAIDINNSVTKTKFDNIYGCRHSLPDGIMRATDVMIAGKQVVICGYGDVGKGCAAAMQRQGARVFVTEIDPICALQALMEGFEVKTIQSVLEFADIFVTATGNINIITQNDFAQMKNNAIVCNIGHFDNEIDMQGLMAVPGLRVENIKPQVDRFVFPDGHGVIVLAQGKLVNLGCATGHPSFVMSCSFTNQAMAQLELWENRESDKYSKKLYVLPKKLDEKVARLHLGALGAELTILTQAQANYIGVAIEGPYKKTEYRY